MTQPHKKSSAWYEQWFGEDYLTVYAHRDEEEARAQVDFAERVLNPPKGGRILDLCCGNGRHAVELSRRGYRVTGLDLSPVLLEAACERARDQKVEVEFVRCDMRQIPGEETFDAVVNFFTSFGYFDRDEENAAVLRGIARALVPEGGFLLDYLNRDYVVRHFVGRDEQEREGMRVIQERRIDPVESRVHKRLTLIKGDQQTVYSESVRMYVYPEMARMIADAGLRIERVYGNHEGDPLTIDSPRMILVGRRPVWA